MKNADTFRQLKLLKSDMIKQGYSYNQIVEYTANEKEINVYINKRKKEKDNIFKNKLLEDELISEDNIVEIKSRLKKYLRDR